VLLKLIDFEWMVDDIVFVYCFVALITKSVCWRRMKRERERGVRKSKTGGRER